jgi:type IV pilus assembly protein PilO
VAFDFNDLNNLDFDNIGEMPLPAKAIVCAILGIVILIGGFMFLNKPQIDTLRTEQAKERDLRQRFELRQRQAANLHIYRRQLVEINDSFGELLRKLPDKTEVPGLLEDISTAGVMSGLQFSLFKPLPENDLSFYAELPIEIAVSGSYHQFAEFISKLSNLERIVTVQDFSLARKPAEQDKQQQGDSELLNIKLIAKTYRYKDEQEIDDLNAR